MKKILSIVVAIMFAVSLTGLCFAQEATAPAAAPEKKLEEKAATKEPKVKKTKKTKKAKEKKPEEQKAAPKEGEPAK